MPPTSPFGNGDTEFADMPARIVGLVIEHGIFRSRGQIGFTNFEPGEREQYPLSLQRLLPTHADRNARRPIFRRTRPMSGDGRWGDGRWGDGPWRMGGCCCSI